MGIKFCTYVKFCKSRCLELKLLQPCISSFSSFTLWNKYKHNPLTKSLLLMLPGNTTVREGASHVLLCASLFILLQEEEEETWIIMLVVCCPEWLLHKRLERNGHMDPKQRFFLNNYNSVWAFWFFRWDNRKAVPWYSGFWPVLSSNHFFRNGRGSFKLTLSSLTCIGATFLYLVFYKDSFYCLYLHYQLWFMMTCLWYP